MVIISVHAGSDLELVDCVASNSPFGETEHKNILTKGVNIMAEIKPTNSLNRYLIVISTL